MASKIMSARLKPQSGGLFKSIRDALATGGGLNAVAGTESFNDFQSGLGAITGNENLNLVGVLRNLKPGQFDALHGALNRGNFTVPADAKEQFDGAVEAIRGVAGNEGFSLNNFQGSQADIKAVNVALNARAHLQTPAAEALFPSISVRYEDEGVQLSVRAAGIGTYAYGNTAWQSASELRPIFGILRTGDMFKDEALAVYPVYPADASDEDRSLFIDPAIRAPYDVNYMQGDAYGRTAHQSQYLKVPNTIPNFLGLCQTPGQRPWTQTDELESNGITVTSLELSASIGGTAGNFFLSTAGMVGVALSPTNQGQMTDDRQLNMHIRNLKGFSVQDKDGVQNGDTVFASFKTAGYEPLLNINLIVNFNRQTNELRLVGGDMIVHALRDTTTGVEISLGQMTAQQRALCKTLTAGLVDGVKLVANVSNTSRGNFGYRIDVWNAIKHLSVKRRSPISVKYPVSKDDVNQESLDFAIDQMAIAINNQASAIAFKEAAIHRAFITSIDGAEVVGNNGGNNVLPGQHFVKATAVNAQLTLRDAVSSQDSAGVYDNVNAAILNQLSDMIAALNTKSGLAAIAEYGASDITQWSVIVHNNLSRFVMRPGDVRTAGPKLQIEPIETNFDSQIGQIIVVPKANSTNDSINPLGGIGVCITKENIVVQGNVTRDNQEFGVLMTLPTYKHWALNPMIGVIEITDAEEFLGDNGLLTQLAKQQVAVDGLKTGLQAIADKDDTTPNP